MGWFGIGRTKGRRRASRHSSGAAAPGRRLIVGDIHGCAQTMRALLGEYLAVSRGDHLHFLGDLVSKGPDSRDVLQFLVELEDAGVGVTVVRGNHEEAILRARGKGPAALQALLERTNNDSLLTADGGTDLESPWLRIMEASRYWVDLHDAILVHGGIDMQRTEPFADGHALVSLRKTTYNARVAGNRPVIHGHTRRPLSTIIESLVTDASVIPLDNGAVGGPSRKPYKVSEYGNLCCLDLDSRILHVQPNRDIGENEPKVAAYCLSVHLANRKPSG
ncbi:MAG: metallophosphoesterase [Alkalispirochaeta sp.]